MSGGHCDYWVERPLSGTTQSNYQCMTTAQYNAEFNAPFRPGPEYWPQFYVGCLFLSIIVTFGIWGFFALGEREPRRSKK